MSVSQTLSVTEVSVDTSTNTSKVRILWHSEQDTWSYNNYTRVAKYYVSINGGAETEYSVSYTLPRLTKQKILDTTITVTHKDDGSGTVKVRTWMDTGISAGVVTQSQTLNLTTIPRASQINSFSATALGEVCTVKWTPKSTNFWYKLRFYCGSFSETTGIIYPNRKSEYSYSLYTLPYTMATQAPSDTTVFVNVELNTYSDSEATVQIGEAHYSGKRVNIPENESTKPNVTMSLSPVTPYEGLENVYLQGRSRVEPFLVADGKYGADITSLQFKVGTKTYEYGGISSDILGTSGDITVSGIATDTRGFARTVTETITVCAYDRPSIIPHTGENNILCRRCLSDGTPDEEGTYLLIKMGRKYNKVVSGGKQNNFCSLSYQYKTDSQPISEYSDPVTILGASASGDFVAIAIPNVVSDISTAYNIQLIAEDTVGESDVVTITVPSSFVTVHAPKEGHGIAFGGYHSGKKDVFDCYFDAKFHGSVSGSVLGLQGCSGDIKGDGDLNEYRVPGVYAIGANSDAETIENMPIPSAGLLYVYASIGQSKVIEGKWVYLTQEFKSYRADLPIYKRELWTDQNGTWSYGKWFSSNDAVKLNVTGGIGKIQATVFNDGTNDVFQLAVYKGENNHILNFSPSGIEYVKDGTRVWKK